MFKREMALGCLKDIQKALALIEERSAIVTHVNDFLCSPEGMLRLDALCMNLIALGESVKNLDKITKELEKSIKTANDNMKIIIDAAKEEDISNLNKVFNQIMKITGNTMKIYSEFDSFMASTIPVIREFLKAKNYI